jgi:hypothetical protein
LGVGSTTIEASTFHGREPEPIKIDLPIARPDSYAVRVIQRLSPAVTAMASAAYVKEPDPDAPDIPFVTRYSGSVYVAESLGGWTFYDALIYGAIHDFDHVGLLSSYAEEFLFRGGSANIWGRFEILQRTPEELALGVGGDGRVPYWVSAATLGYTQVVVAQRGFELGIGGAVTKDSVPNAFARVAGGYGEAPWTGRVFVQISGAGMFGM